VVAEFGLMENSRRSKSLSLCDQVQTDLLFMIIFFRLIVKINEILFGYISHRGLVYSSLNTISSVSTTLTSTTSSIDDFIIHLAKDLYDCEQDTIQNDSFD